MSYKDVRSIGGLKGLGTGARSYRRGANVVRSTVTTMSRPQPRRTYNSIIPRRRSRISGYSNYSMEIKTVDHTFYGAYVQPYVPDLLAKTVLNASTTGALQALMIQQGVGTSQRVGNSCCLKSIRLRFRLARTGTDTDNPSMMRMLLIYDRQPTGTANYPATSTILADINEAGTTSAFDTDGDLNVNSMDRYVILMDEWHQVPACDNTAAGLWTYQGPTDTSQFVVDRFIKLKGLEQKYQATSSPMTIGNQTTGALYLLGCGNIATGSEPFAWIGKARLRFYDP